MEYLNLVIEEAPKYLTKQNLIYAAGTFAALKVAQCTVSHWKKKSKERYHKKRAHQKRQKRNNDIKALSIADTGFDKNFEEKVLNASLQEQKQMLEKGEITSVQLLNLYAKRATTIGLDLNLITETNYKNALLEAKQKDELRQTNPEQCKGELFGLVMSIKDTFDLKGFASTIGLAARVDRIQQDDGYNIKILKNAGVIIFVKTNIPQIAMILESENEVWGLAKNPWDIKRTVGGSTGGGGALVAARCTPLEFGSDIGGSIRVPGAFNGVAAFKPSSQRLPFKGHTYYHDTFNGQKTVGCTVGPLSKYVDDGVMLLKSILNEENFKSIKASERPPHFLNLPFNNELYTTKKKLRVGYIYSFDAFRAGECSKRAVKIAKEALAKQGHELVEVRLPKVEELIQYFFNIIVSDARQSFDAMLEGEKPLHLYDALLLAYGLGKCTRNFLGGLLKLLGQKRVGHTVQTADGLDSIQYKIVTAKIDAIRQEYFEFFEDNNLDVIMTPAFGVCAPPHGFSALALDPFYYASFVNAIDYPSGVVPVTVVQENEQNYEDGINDIITSQVRNFMKDSAGMPVAVQVIARPYQEEIALNVLRQIESEVKFSENHPYKK